LRHSSLVLYRERVLNNINKIKSMLYPHQKIISIVKADGYGVGAKNITSILKENGINFFGVATIYEAINLREIAPDADILVLSPLLENEIKLYLENNIITTITDIKRASIINRMAYSQNKVVRAHVKVDTGMGRLGVLFYDAKVFIKSLLEFKNIRLDGIFTHFPSADIKDDFTLEQINIFKTLIEDLKKDGVTFSCIHSANSGGIVFYNDPFFNFVRPGLMIYGGYSSNLVKNSIELKTSIKWSSKVLDIKKIKKGTSISYGRTFVAPRDMTIGIVGVGYADGFLSLNSNKGFFYINGGKAKILGRVCMDYTVVDITGIDAEIGSEVIICDDIDGIRINDISDRSGLIPYEVLTSISCNIKKSVL